jgi:hypothetical protein
LVVAFVAMLLGFEALTEALLLASALDDAAALLDAEASPLKAAAAVLLSAVVMVVVPAAVLVVALPWPLEAMPNVGL